VQDNTRKNKDNIHIENVAKFGYFKMNVTNQKTLTYCGWTVTSLTAEAGHIQNLWLVDIWLTI
jgi:hypothetical protein